MKDNKTNTESDIYIEEALRSYGMCCMNEEFFEHFYNHFLGASLEVKEKFKNIDFSRHKALFKSSITFALMYARKPEDSFAKDRIQDIGKLHSRNRININPELYSVWKDALIATVKDFDPDFTEFTEKSWNDSLKSAIEVFVSLY